MPQKPEEEKLKSFAFCLIFLKLQLFHYFKQHHLKDMMIDIICFIHIMREKSGVYS